MSATISPQDGAPVASSPLSTECGGACADLRAFIQELEAAGRLVRVKTAVDWKFALGKMARTCRAPLLFENITGYPGQPVFTNGLCDAACIAIALGLNAGVSRENLVKEAKWRATHPIDPVVVESGPVLENIVEEDDIDLRKLPVPWWSERDAGRYLGTWHVNVTKDPKTHARNVGVYRMQLLGRTQATVSASPASHLSRHLAKSEKEGRPLPMAVAIGVSEVVMMAAAAACPAGMDEYCMAGALQQRPVELVRCETVDIEVPARSEIVIEGQIQPDVRVQDGPYFDYTGKTNTNPRAYLFVATRVTFRNDPIFRGTSIGMPGAEDHQLFALLAELGLVDFHGSRLKQAAQNLLLRRRLFRGFQLAGELGAMLSGKKKRQEKSRLPEDARD